MKKLFLLTLILCWNILGCAAQIPNATRQEISDLEQGVVFYSDNDILKVRLNRNQDLGEIGSFSVMTVQVNLPLSLPLEADKTPSRYFGLSLKNITSPTKSIRNKKMLFIFGRMKEAPLFENPQEKDQDTSISLVNYKWLDDRLQIEPDYYKVLLKKVNTLDFSSIIYNITNEYYGCAYYCDGESSIILKNKMNGNVNYTFHILFFDNDSTKADPRDKEIWELSFGFFKEKTFELLKNQSYSQVKIDFDQTKTKLKDNEQESFVGKTLNYT